MRPHRPCGTPGGGVGPHLDSYDVFLVQGEGRRRWRVWRPGKTFHGEFICEKGDLLYLPPGGLHVFWNCTLGFQLGRTSPLSIWTLYPGIDWIVSIAVDGTSSPTALMRKPNRFGLPRFTNRYGEI